jgi:hypothetical protein
MATPVSLRTVADELEMLGLGDGLHVFLNRDTGELAGGTDDQLARAGDEDGDDDTPDWERDVLERLRDVLDSPAWVELPGRDGRADWRVMERFGEAQPDGRVRAELLDAIRGTGAFGRFKDVCARRGLLPAWAAFHRAAGASSSL